MTLEIVEVFEGFHVGGYFVKPAGRVMAWKSGESWVVYFNGAEVPVPAGTVGPIRSTAQNTERASPHSAARLEQYAVAPAAAKA